MFMGRQQTIELSVDTAYGLALRRSSMPSLKNLAADSDSHVSGQHVRLHNQYFQNPECLF